MIWPLILDEPLTCMWLVLVEIIYDLIKDIYSKPRQQSILLKIRR